jgi:hypothetical protein
MNGMLGVLSYGIGTILGVVLIGGLIVLIIHDVTQKKHTVLRNFPVVGRLRFFFEDLGEYFRQYFFAGDRAELPFNRATRGFIYRLAKGEGSIIGFGSTNDLREPGSIIFVNHPFPVLEEDRLPPRARAHARARAHRADREPEHRAQYALSVPDGWLARGLQESDNCGKRRGLDAVRSAKC